MVQILSTHSFAVDQVLAKVVFLYAKKSHQLVSVINYRHVTQTIDVSTVTMLYFIMGKWMSKVKLKSFLDIIQYIYWIDIQYIYPVYLFYILYLWKNITAHTK